MKGATNFHRGGFEVPRESNLLHPGLDQLLLRPGLDQLLLRPGLDQLDQLDLLDQEEKSPGGIIW